MCVEKANVSLEVSVRIRDEFSFLIFSIEIDFEVNDDDDAEEEFGGDDDAGGSRDDGSRDGGGC